MTDAFHTVLANTPRYLLRDDLCKASGDPKLHGSRLPIYVPEQDYDHAVKTLSRPDQAKPLPTGFDPSPFYHVEAEHGLLYLPFPYLVPGGRFNEMYGWDSAFPVFAWTDTHPRLMREQIDNQLYQIRRYGKVLNANRTYYISRSQPPLLSMMVMHLWQATQNRDWKDFDPDGLYANAEEWLSQAYDDLLQSYTYWTTGDRLAGDTGLSRYWDDGDVAAPEVEGDEKGHFEHAREFYAHHATTPDDREDASLFYDPATDTLTPLYHQANRAMRASGFDPTGHWGYGALRCMFNAPICLNALLFGMEKDMADFARALNKGSEEDSLWNSRRAERKRRMKELMFDAETGVYFDYDFIRKRKNTKPFATIFHSFWTGLYDQQTEADELRRAVSYALNHLETPFGVTTSNEVSGSQWDHPYGWPPLQYFAFEGLHRCGYEDDARRIANNYLSLARNVFAQHRSLFEKYNMEEGNAEIRVVHGYHENVSEHGTFLWTAATLTLAEKRLSA